MSYPLVEDLQKKGLPQKYASSEHQALLAKHGLVDSMSRKGNLSPNAFERESKSQKSIELSELLDHYTAGPWTVDRGPQIALQHAASRAHLGLEFPQSVFLAT